MPCAVYCLINLHSVHWKLSRCVSGNNFSHTHAYVWSQYNTAAHRTLDYIRITYVNHSIAKLAACYAFTSANRMKLNERTCDNYTIFLFLHVTSLHSSFSPTLVKRLFRFIICVVSEHVMCLPVCYGYIHKWMHACSVCCRFARAYNRSSITFTVWKEETIGWHMRYAKQSTRDIFSSTFDAKCIDTIDDQS